MSDASLEAGQRVDDRYVLEELLGSGSVGEVWLASDERLPGRKVAVKFLSADRSEDQRARLHDAVAITAMTKILHPGVVPVTDRGEWNSRQFLVSDFQEGQTLERWLVDRRASGRVPTLVEVWSLFEPLLDAMAAAHAMPEPGPVVHENLRPSNIVLVAGPRGDMQVRVLDFGTSRLVGRVSTPGTATSPYASPEQAAGQNSLVGPHVDVFALGVLLLELLTLSDRYDGEAPWWATAMQRDHELMALLRPLRPELPDAVWQVLARALRGRAAQRIVDAGAFQEALRAVWPLPTATRVVDDDSPTTPKLSEAVAIDPLPSVRPAALLAPVTDKPAIGAPPIRRESTEPKAPEKDAKAPAREASKAPAAKDEGKPSARAPASKASKDESGKAPTSSKEKEAPAAKPAESKESGSKGVPLSVVLLGLGVVAVGGWFLRGLGTGGHTPPPPAPPVAPAPPTPAPPPAPPPPPAPAVQATDVAAAPPPSAPSSPTDPCPSSMVLVAAGTFSMGYAERGAQDDERPAHTVSVSTFCLDRTEVTVAQYRACESSGRCAALPGSVSLAGASEADQTFWSQRCNTTAAERQDHPVNCVDWAAAQRYCEAQGGALPTEAQWELAARGPTPRAFPWGDTQPDATLVNACGPECKRSATQAGWTYTAHWDDGSGESCRPGSPDEGSVHCSCDARFGELALRRACRFGLTQAYSAEDPFEGTAPVGRLPRGASPSGALDLAGNVWEWTADYFAPYGRDAQSDPRGPAQGTLRVARGGGWTTFEAARLRATRRLSVDPTWRHADLGFRCARPTAGSSGAAVRDGAVAGNR